jgi:transposase, IS5 family
MVAMPAAPISPSPSNAASPTSPFTKSAASPLPTWSKSPWVYCRLRNCRAGIEASISCFKRAYGAARCTWRGLQHFKA